MQPKPIEFQRRFDLGSNISSTFDFLKSNYKPLLSTLWFSCRWVFIIFIVAQGAYLYFAGDLQSSLTFQVGLDDDNLFKSLISILIYFISAIVLFTLAQATIYEFVLAYQRDSQTFDRKAIAEKAWGDIGTYLIANFAASLVIILGAMLCLIPGIYLWPPLSLVVAICVFENTSVSNAFSQAFKLIKDNWWETFLTLVVLYLIVAFMGAIFQIPMYLYMFASMFMEISDGGVDNIYAIAADPIYLGLQLMAAICSTILYIIIYVSTAFIYYNLNERRTQSGAMSRIETLGN